MPRREPEPWSADYCFPRRSVLLGAAALSGLAAAGGFGRLPTAHGAARDDSFDTDSTFFGTAFVEYAASLATNSDGDLWPTCWADDDHLYAANGDGRGFRPSGTRSDIVVNRIIGDPASGISGERLARGEDVAPVWGDPELYNRKPTGMVAVDGDGDGRDELYLAVQDLRRPPCPACFNDAPAATVCRSDDYGKTWHATAEPMFTDYRFTTIFFLDFGQSNEHVRTLGEEAARYVYAYGMDWNWRDSFSDTVPDPTALYLARVPTGAVQDRSAWQFFTGTRPNGDPTWSARFASRVPVLRDERRVYPTLRGGERKNMTVVSQGGVVYNEPLDRYLYTSWTEYTYEFYEAPRPWGPWRLFLRKDFGAHPWFGTATDPDCRGPKNGGYATTIPSKFISDDGKTMWVQSNWFVGVACGEPNYHFSLRRFTVEPYRRTAPTNKPDPADNLARTGADTTVVEKSAHYGHGNYLNDGRTDRSEDSFDRTNKVLDFWGYTWSQSYRMDQLVYTTGEMFEGGGWFADAGTGLRVQVRRNFEWVDVAGLEVSPRYPYDATAGPYRTYTLTFRDTWGDGVRIVGPAGGSAHFTSIAELAVHYTGRSRTRRTPLRGDT